MANEELIYRITRAIYERLGTNADERTVEDLVAGIYRAIEPMIENGDARASSSLPNVTGSNNRGGSLPSSSERVSGSGAERDERDAASRLVVSVFGVDRPGIVAAVSQILAAEECSIVDINQTVVAGKFAMVLIADTERSHSSAVELKERLRQEGTTLGIRIYAQREDLFNAMHRI